MAPLVIFTCASGFNRVPKWRSPRANKKIRPIVCALPHCVVREGIGIGCFGTFAVLETSS